MPPPDPTPCPGLFDVDAVSQWLRRDVDWPKGAPLLQAELNRLWAGRNGRVTFELNLTLDTRPSACTVTLQGGLGAPPQTEQSHRCARVTPLGLMGLRHHNAERGVWCCTPDRDRKIRSAGNLLTQKKLETLLQAWPPNDPSAFEAPASHGLDNATISLTAYRVHRRCVVRVRFGHQLQKPGLFFKAYRRDLPHQRLTAWRQLAKELTTRSQGAVRMPEFVAYPPRDRLLVLQEVPLPAHKLGHTADDTRRTAEALATLHTIAPSRGESLHTPEHELATVQRWIDVLPMVCSSPRARRLRRITDKLVSLVKTVHPEATTWIHRDFHGGQLLRHRETLWMLDFDTLSIGHPEQDVATFLAHGLLARLTDDQPAPPETRAPETFLDFYHTFGGRLRPESLRFYLPCALARLGAIHTARGLAAHRIDRLWDAAESILDHRTNLADMCAACSTGSDSVLKVKPDAKDPPASQP